MIGWRFDEEGCTREVATVPMNPLQAPNIERLVAACRREKLDRTPNFEDCLDPRATGHLLGRPSAPSSILPPPASPATDPPAAQPLLL